MNNETILKKAIEKAKKNGWKDYPAGLTIVDWEEYLSIEEWANLIIFSHDFAKAFWGKTKNYFQHKDGQGNIILSEIMYEWEYHLQQMVLEKEPLKYIEKFLT